MKLKIGERTLANQVFFMDTPLKFCAHADVLNTQAYTYIFFLLIVHHLRVIWKACAVRRGIKNPEIAEFPFIRNTAERQDWVHPVISWIRCQVDERTGGQLYALLRNRKRLKRQRTQLKFAKWRRRLSCSCHYSWGVVGALGLQEELGKSKKKGLLCSVR